jgi:histidinol-phosphate aminotransferase
MKLNIPENIKAIQRYTPARQLSVGDRPLGSKESIKLASNENPWGPSPRVTNVLQSAIHCLNRYPDDSCYSLVRALASHYGMPPDSFVVGNGSTEVIELLVKCFVRGGDRVIVSHPSCLLYRKFVQVSGGETFLVPLKKMSHDLSAILAGITEKTRLIFLDNPNNPTGTSIEPVDLYVFLSKVPEEVIVVLDETYVEFMESDQKVDVFSLIKNFNGRCAVVSVRTFSKAYGLSGLRIGFGIMPEEIAECIHRVRKSFNISSMAQVAARAALEDDKYLLTTIERTWAGREWLKSELIKSGCVSYPSRTNFILVDVQGKADPLCEAMLHKGVIIRSLRNYGFPDCIRVSVGTEKENSLFVTALSECLHDLNYV